MLGNKVAKIALAMALVSLLGLASQANAECKLVSTKDGSPLPIKVVDTDTPEAKEFLETCKNPYTKRYVADAEAAKAGKKKFGFWSCTQCHGLSLIHI